MSKQPDRQQAPKLTDGPAPVANSANDLPTACILCTHNCSIRVDVLDNEVVAVRADDSSPITGGYSCNKAYAIGSYIKHPQRTQHPMKRRADGSFERISWDQAMREIAAKLNEIQSKHAKRSVAIAGVGGQGNHMGVPWALAFMLGIGSRVVFNALAQEKTQHMLVNRWMFRTGFDAYVMPDHEHTTYEIILGSNPAISNMGGKATDHLKRMKNDPQCKLVVIDPKATETTRRAHWHLRIKPSGDVYLLLGMAATIVTEGLHDHDTVRDRVVGFEALKQSLSEVDVAEMARRCGLELADLLTLTREFAKAPSAAIHADLGAEHIRYSTLVSYLVRVICLITGNIGKRGGMIWHQAMAGKLPYPETLEPRALVSGLPAIPMFLPVGLFSPNLLPEEIMTNHPDRVRALIVDGANPLVQYADSHKQREALSQLELLVVIDPAFSETAQVAHYVLPTPVGYEKWETHGIPNPYPHIGSKLRPPVVRGPDEALPEPEIYFRLIREMKRIGPPPGVLKTLAAKARGGLGAMGYFGLLGPLAAIRGGGVDAILSRMAFWMYESLGPTLPSPSISMIWFYCHTFALTRRGLVTRMYPETRRMLNPFKVGAFLFDKILAHPEGVWTGMVDTSRDFENNCHYPDKKARVMPPEMVGEIKRALANDLNVDAAYPYILQGGMRTPWEANTLLRTNDWRKGKGPFCPVLISPEDAAKIGVKTGDQVQIKTTRGAVQGPAVVDNSTRPGHIHVPTGFGLDIIDPVTGKLVRNGIRINELTDAQDRDPFTGCPPHKHVRCMVVAVPQEPLTADLDCHPNIKEPA